ncbi:MAG: UMP kinase [Planctomycetota bacterium]|nr:MAG: UMP kinase [Planctomycetota bacterium]
MRSGAAPVFKRIILKISGEAMRGGEPCGLDYGAVETIAREIAAVQKLGVETAVVIGGGNIVRGAAISKMGISRVPADYMGLLATVINGIALQERLESIGAEARLMSAGISLDAAEPYVRRRALTHLDNGRIVILTGGTGNPLFTTDTCAALRAAELGAEVLLKATKVDGVYTADPKTHPDASLIPRLTYLECLKQELKVMDAAAISLCSENKIPIIVFNMNVPDNIVRVVLGERIGSVVEGNSNG